jgi:hypothetical protein
VQSKSLYRLSLFSLHNNGFLVTAIGTAIGVHRNRCMTFMSHAPQLGHLNMRHPSSCHGLELLCNHNNGFHATAIGTAIGVHCNQCVAFMSHAPQSEHWHIALGISCTTLIGMLPS